MNEILRKQNIYTSNFHLINSTFHFRLTAARVHDENIYPMFYFHFGHIQLNREILKPSVVFILLRHDRNIKEVFKGQKIP